MGVSAVVRSRIPVPRGGKGEISGGFGGIVVAMRGGISAGRDSGTGLKSRRTKVVT